MNILKQKWIIINVVALVAIVVAFVLINIRISKEQKHRFALVEDDSKYCYGIDSFTYDGGFITLRGWFFELKSIQKISQSVSREDAERTIALIPLAEASVGSVVENTIIMKTETMYEDRPYVNEYFSCEYDYSRCGFTSTLDCNNIDLRSNSYRVAVKLDSEMSSRAVLTNIYITSNGIVYTDPRQSPELDVEGTGLDRIIREGVRLVSRPDYGCYVYQFGDKLYWIADEGFSFCENGFTYMQYQMDTTQIDRLPKDRLEHNWFWSNIGGGFELYEITDQINCGRYRVMVRNIPKEYSVTNVVTGYHDGEKWIWKEMFKIDYKGFGWKK